MGTQAVANRRFLGAAVALHLVTDHQVTEMQELLDTGDPDLDLPSEMTARGYITGEQKNAALAIAEQSISFAGESGDAAAPHGAAADNHTDGFAVTRVVWGDGSSPPHEGESFGQYTITGMIGEGGLGRVLHAVDRSLQRDVAIKEMLEQHAAQRDKRLLARFLTEARVTGQLQHPGIVPVYQIGLKPDGNLFYVMKYVRGHTMEDALKDCEALPFVQRMGARLKLVDCLIDVCEAIGYAHERNVLHRDIKPGNIVMGHHGENVILDWGLAKHIGTPDDTTGTSTTGDGITVMRVDRAAAELTGVDECIGTPAYMSPEQVCPDLGIVDKRSDVYALGVILYRILTGDFLYHAETVERLLMTIASDDPSPDPSRLSPDCPRDLAGICITAIDKNKTKRFPDAAAMAQELRAWRDGRTVSIYHYSTGELVRRFVQRNKPLVAAMAVAAVAVVAGLAFSVYYAMAAGRMAQVARRNAERARGHATEAHEAEDKARRSERRAVANEAAVREAVRAIPRLQNLSLLRSEKLGREVQSLFDAIGTSASLIALSAEECGADREHAQLLLARLARTCPEFGAWAILTTTGSVVVDWPDNACAAFSPAEKARDAMGIRDSHALSRHCGDDINAQLSRISRVMARSDSCSQLISGNERGFARTAAAREYHDRASC